MGMEEEGEGRIWKCCWVGYLVIALVLPFVVTLYNQNITKKPKLYFTCKHDTMAYLSFL